MSRNKQAWFALGAAVLLACVPYLYHKPRLGVPTSWTPRDFHAALEAAGLHYEQVADLPDGEGVIGGCYLKRRGDAVPWSALATVPRAPLFAQRGRLCIIVTPQPPSSLVSPPAHGIAQIGHIMLYGHPDELTEVVGLFRREADGIAEWKPGAGKGA